MPLIIGRLGRRRRDGPRSPDLVEAITAWRAWSLRREPSGRLALTPIHTKGMVWPARGPARAACAARGERGWHPHRSPGEGCRCGIYAAKRLEQLPRDAYVVTAATAVVGSVAVWGKVIEHERGYRVEFAYPDRIRLVCAGCLCLFSERVPDGVVRFADGLLAPICAEHLPVMWLDPKGPPLAGAPLDAELIQEELLATYAVDLLSLATLNRARLRAKAKYEASSS